MITILNLIGVAVILCVMIIGCINQYLYERKCFNKGICPDCGEMLQYQGDVDGDQQWQCNNCKYTTYIGWFRK